MLRIGLFFSSFRYFYAYSPSRFWLLTVLTLLLGLNQGVSILMLIPLLGMLKGAAANGDGLSAKLHGMLVNLGIPISLELVLICFTVLLLGASLLSYVKSLWQSRYEQGFILSLRTRLFAKIASCDWLELNSKSKHTHIQVLSNEIPKLSTYYFALVNMLSALLIILAHVALAVWVAPLFTLLVVAIGAASFFLLRQFLAKSFKLGGINIGLFRAMLKQLDDFWLMIKSAKVHSAEGFYVRMYEKTCRGIYDIQQRQSRNRALSQLVFTISGTFGMLLLVYVGFRLEMMSFTSIFVLILLFGRLFPLFTSVSSYLDIVVSNIQSVRMVVDVDQTLVASALVNGEVEPSASFDGAIHLHNVHFAYPDGPTIFRGLSLSIAANAITGILGVSGRGKTTLLDVLSGLVVPQQGEVSVGGIPLTTANIAQWRSTIGYLPQDSFFVDGTIRDNLVWDSRVPISDEQIVEVLDKVGARQLVDRYADGLHSFISNYQYHFSGGERQRLALARVLLRFPKVLLLDEATSSLDVYTEKIVMDTLQNLKKELTIIFVTHRRSIVGYFDYTVELTSDKQKAIRVG